MINYVIGDIHGGLLGLKQVLERAPIQKEDRLIFLGDYVDGWSDNLKTIDYLISISTKYNCIFLRGNHDDLLLKYLTKEDDNPMWLAHGGAATKANYENASDKTVEKHIHFLNSLSFYFIDESNNLFVHAGFTNIKGPEFEYFKEMVYWDRSLWELAQCLDPKLSPKNDNYPNRLKLHKEIFIGHTPIRKEGLSNPKQSANVWNIDTGAAFKGTVTIMNINTKEFWQSDPLWKLYPNEQGRN